MDEKKSHCINEDVAPFYYVAYELSCWNFFFSSRLVNVAGPTCYFSTHTYANKMFLHCISGENESERNSHRKVGKGGGGWLTISQVT